ncbi:hypothetical protein LOK49_LG03G03506 [Camellia lanceoleosa]|uniref:Uncharacterized protein n=1 Tax=Camellia lanceoleosa TaxID=1840588 RepID=A0ACC0IF87_9ERIC|nr:hypothetical protein LOK49_LG03G03506 [Camellia lanceoleosa]
MKFFISVLTSVLEKVSKSVWDLILDSNGLGKETSETVERVFCRLSVCEPPLFPLNVETQSEKEKERERKRERKWEGEFGALSSFGLLQGLHRCLEFPAERLYNLDGLRAFFVSEVVFTQDPRINLTPRFERRHQWLPDHQPVGICTIVAFNRSMSSSLLLVVLPHLSLSVQSLRRAYSKGDAFRIELSSFNGFYNVSVLLR